MTNPCLSARKTLRKHKKQKLISFMNNYRIKIFLLWWLPSLIKVEVRINETLLLALSYDLCHWWLLCNVSTKPHFHYPKNTYLKFQHFVSTFPSLVNILSNGGVVIKLCHLIFLLKCSFDQRLDGKLQNKYIA